MPNIGPLELGIVLLIVLVIFGPKRLPGLGRQLGAGMREFKDAITGKKDSDDEVADVIDRPDADARRALGQPADEPADERADERAREPAP
jgi:sec-independent protein translocase protein TatA